MLELVPAGLQDIPVIQRLSSEIWWKYYPSIIGFKQVGYMLNKFYSDESLKKQMTDLKHRFYLIRSKKKYIGLISIEDKKRKKFFLHKFYILPEVSGKGIGSKVFKRIIKILSAQEVRLTVNRQNYKAINFYFKNGFIIERVEDFDIGNGFYMNDFVMLWKAR